MDCLSGAHETGVVVGCRDLNTDLWFALLFLIQDILASENARETKGNLTSAAQGWASNATTDSVSRFMSVAWRRTLSSNAQPAQAGQSAKADEDDV